MTMIKFFGIVAVLFVGVPLYNERPVAHHPRVILPRPGIDTQGIHTHEDTLSEEEKVQFRRQGMEKKERKIVVSSQTVSGQIPRPNHQPVIAAPPPPPPPSPSSEGAGVLKEAESKSDILDRFEREPTPVDKYEELARRYRRRH